MRLRDKAVKLCSAPRRLAAILVLTVLFIQFGCGALYAMSKQVSIVDENGSITVTSFKKNIAEVLAKEGIMLGEADEVYPPMDARLCDNQVIKVSRAKNITLFDGKETFRKLTAKENVKAALEQFGIALSEGTELNVAPDDAIINNMEIRITYNTEQIISTEEAIPFKTVKKTSDSLSPGETKVSQEGKEGVIQKNYKVSYVNGDEVGREFVSQEEKAAAVDKVIEYGKPAASSLTVAQRGSVVSRGSEFRYKAVLNVTATAYDLSYESCGKNPGDRGYGVTASGMKAQYGVIAVDPRVIPLGTRLYIEAADGSWSYGHAVAGDTGGAIKGNKIDLFFNTRAECLNFGRRQAVVYILE